MITIGFALLIVSLCGMYFYREKTPKYSNGPKLSLEAEKKCKQSMKRLCREFDFPDWKYFEAYQEVEAEKRYMAKAAELVKLKREGLIDEDGYRKEIEPYYLALSPDSIEYMFGVKVPEIK